MATNSIPNAKANIAYFFNSGTIQQNVASVLTQGGNRAEVFIFGSGCTEFPSNIHATWFIAWLAHSPNVSNSAYGFAYDPSQSQVVPISIGGLF